MSGALPSAAPGEEGGARTAAHCPAPVRNEMRKFTAAVREHAKPRRMESRGGGVRWVGVAVAVAICRPSGGEGFRVVATHRTHKPPVAVILSTLWNTLRARTANCFNLQGVLPGEGG